MQHEETDMKTIDIDNNVALTEAIEQMNEAVKAVEAAEAVYHASLRNIRKVAGGAMFTFNGRVMQVRERRHKDVGEKVPFLVDLETTPKEWLARAKARKLEALDEAKASIRDSQRPPQRTSVPPVASEEDLQATGTEGDVNIE